MAPVTVVEIKEESSRFNNETVAAIIGLLSVLSFTLPFIPAFCAHAAPEKAVKNSKKTTIDFI